MSEYRLIPLSGKKGAGLFAKVDPGDYEALSNWSWCLSTNGYAMRGTRRADGKFYAVKMHREVLGLAPGSKTLVDHRNRDRLDNQKANLREVNKAQNGMNSMTSTGSSGFKGVSWDKHKNRWEVHIRVSGAALFLGRYDDEREAAFAYDKAARHYFGEYACTNFRGSETVSAQEVALSQRQKRAERLTSKYYGVVWQASRNKWAAQISVGGRNKPLGRFTSEEVAARAFDVAAISLRGKGTRLNFPLSQYETEEGH